MRDFFEDLYDEQEPSFSIYDFKKWLTAQGDEPIMEVQRPVPEEVLEKFKKRVHDKIRKRRKANGG